MSIILELYNEDQSVLSIITGEQEAHNEVLLEKE